MSSASAGRYSGEASLWILLLGDILMYSLFMVFFGYERSQQLDLYQSAQATLNPAFGFFNTLVLLTGSWFVVRGLRALSTAGPTADQRHRAGRFFLFATVSGGVFALSKIVEYTLKAQAGISLTDNAFYTYYFALTGFHFLHVLIGMVVLFYLRRHVLGAGAINRRFLESGANFWHLVDMLWILLFPVIYLV